MESVVLFTKSDCDRCHRLKQWLIEKDVEFEEKSLESTPIASKVIQDPSFTKNHCHGNPCKLFPPILYFPHTNTYIQNQLFDIKGIRNEFLSEIFVSSHKLSQKDVGTSDTTEQPQKLQSQVVDESGFGSKFCRNTLVEDLLRKYILALGISRVGGGLLYCIQIEKSLNLDLISQFIAALSMFGEENLGKIDRIMIKGLEIEMSIVTRHELVFFVLFKPQMVQDYLDEESERSLNIFYRKYRRYIDANRSNRALYEEFDKEMCLAIQNYLVRIGVLECVDCSLEIPILREKSDKPRSV
ncbi:MAG: glutaredoxin family protein [Promethearchaeota archaeon]